MGWPGASIGGASALAPGEDVGALSVNASVLFNPPVSALQKLCSMLATTRAPVRPATAPPASQDLGSGELKAEERTAVRWQMNGPPVGEQTRELCLRHARPGPYAACVDMHEAGRGIEADAAPLQPHGDVVQALRRDPR